MYFKDRVDAGNQLAEKLTGYRDKNAIVFGIPRGGVVVAEQIAKKLNARLDVVIPRKIGAPGNSELAIGAVAGKSGILLNKKLIDQLEVSDDYIDKAVFAERNEINRREKLYRKGNDGYEVTDKIAILADDGLATGFTAKAAIKDLKSLDPKQIILAVPVAPPETILEIKETVDDVLCLYSPEIFFAIGQFYENFFQVSDEEVIDIMIQARERMLSS